MLSSFTSNFISNIANLKILHICNHSDNGEESLIFPVPRDLKLKAILIIEPQTLSSTMSEV